MLGYYRYTVKWSDEDVHGNVDRGTDRGVLAAESYGHAAKQIEEYYGPSLCNLRLGHLEIDAGLGITVDHLEELLEDIGLEEGLNA